MARNYPLGRCGTMSLMSQPPADGRMPLGTQLTRFVLTGGLSAVVDYGLLVLGMALGLSHSAAKALSWLAGTVTAYAINRRWTFVADPSAKRFAAVAALYLVTFVLQWGTFTVLYPWLERALGTGLAQFAGFVVAQGIATTVNFVMQRAVIFRRV